MKIKDGNNLNFETIASFFYSLQPKWNNEPIIKWIESRSVPAKQNKRGWRTDTLPTMAHRIFLLHQPRNCLKGEENKNWKWDHCQDNYTRRHGTNWPTSHSAWIQPTTLATRWAKRQTSPRPCREWACREVRVPCLNTAPPTGVHSHGGRDESRMEKRRRACRGQWSTSVFAAGCAEFPWCWFL